MKNVFRRKYILLIISLITAIISLTSYAAKSKDTKSISPIVTKKIINKAKDNNYWKIAFITGKQGQVVFMNVSPETNPKNEIGMETHPFDQIIIIAQGNGKAILNNKTFNVEEGDLIFIPQGTEHNVINLNKELPLKIISIYSDTDIPANSSYKKKKNEPKE